MPWHLSIEEKGIIWSRVCSKWLEYLVQVSECCGRHLPVDLCQDGRGAVLWLGGQRGRRTLRQDGPQRHRVRRHATHQVSEWVSAHTIHCSLFNNYASLLADASQTCGLPFAWRGRRAACYLQLLQHQFRTFWLHLGWASETCAETGSFFLVITRWLFVESRNVPAS